MTIDIECRIQALETEARDHGDEEQSRLCRRALSGNSEAMSRCLAVLADAAAQEDGP